MHASLFNSSLALASIIGDIQGTEGEGEGDGVAIGGALARRKFTPGGGL